MKGTLVTTNLACFAGAAAALCCFCLQAFCDPSQPSNPPQVPNAILPGKPAISPSSTSADLDNYVRYLHQQGNQILDRQQQMNGRGTVVSFHLRAARPQGTPTAGSPKSFVVVDGDYRRMIEKITVVNEKVVSKRKEVPDANQPKTASNGKPPLSTHASKSDLEKYVQYYRQKSYIVTERQEKFKEDGTLLLFRFHAFRSSGTLSVPSSFVDALVTPKIARDTVYSGPAHSSPTLTFRSTPGLK